MQCAFVMNGVNKFQDKLAAVKSCLLCQQSIKWKEFNLTTFLKQLFVDIYELLILLLAGLVEAFGYSDFTGYDLRSKRPYMLKKLLHLRKELFGAFNEIDENIGIYINTGRSLDIIHRLEASGYARQFPPVNAIHQVWHLPLQS